jgi:hypothetical protein
LPIASFLGFENRLKVRRLKVRRLKVRRLEGWKVR